MMQTPAKKLVLVVSDYQRDSLKLPTDDQGAVDAMHANICTFIDKCSSKFSSIVMLTHTMSPFAPCFAENWRFVNTGLPVPAGSLMYVDKGENLYYVGTQEVRYRFAKSLPKEVEKLRNQTILTESRYVKNSAGAAICYPIDIAKLKVIDLNDIENFSPALAPPIPADTTRVYIIGHLACPDIVLQTLAWAGNASVYVLTDLTRGSLPELQEVGHAHSIDVFGRIYPQDPVPMHVQPLSGGYAEASREWKDAVTAMQTLASARKYTKAAKPKGRNSSVALSLASSSAANMILADDLPVNPFCRTLPPGLGSLPYLGRNHMFVTIFIVQLEDEDMVRYRFAYGENLMSMCDPLLYTASAVDSAWKAAFGSKPGASKFEEPVVVYCGYLPHADNTLNAWKHCMVMAVNVDSLSAGVVAEGERSHTAFENEMIKLVEWMSLSPSMPDDYHYSKGVAAEEEEEERKSRDPVWHALETATDKELRYMLPGDAYFFMLVITDSINVTGEDLCLLMDRCPDASCCVDMLLKEGLQEWIDRIDAEKIRLLLENHPDADSDDRWYGMVFGIGRSELAVGSFLGQLLVDDAYDMTATRLMMKGIAKHNADKLYSAVNRITGKKPGGKQLSARECSRVASSVSKRRISIKHKI